MMKLIADLRPTSLLLATSSSNRQGEYLVGMARTYQKQRKLLRSSDPTDWSLPLEFVKLKRLKKLYLGGNYFNGEIPEEYSEFPRLKSLGLQGNELSGRIPGSLSKLSTLEELFLGYYNSYESGIPPEFGSFKSLKLLDIGGCNLSGEIPASLGDLKRLNYLFLQRNNLTGEIPPKVSGLVSLKKLDLSINGLTGGIPEGFSKMKNLTLLNLFRINLSGDFSAFIADLPNLEVLQLWENNFTGSLPENLGRNGKLSFIDVAGNNLSGTIPVDICNGGKLQFLFLMENSFVGPLPETLGGCKSLINIQITRNFLNGTIPAGIFNLPELTTVKLDDNNFSGELPNKMYSNSIEIVSITNNQITGKIPPAIGGLVNLRTLSFQNNNLTSGIPEELFNLKKLDKVIVSGNNLTGVIPASIGNCSELISVDFSHNGLYGEIPKEIMKLQMLSSINFSRNHLIGEIPNILGEMKSVAVLDLSYNWFSGRIPFDGKLRYFSNTIFVGNPNLCSPNIVPCPTIPKLKRHLFSKSKLFIVTIVLIITTISVSGAVFVVISKKKRIKKPQKWKLTAFQHLGFEVEDILVCLKDENVIGKGGAGIVYHGLMPNGVNVAIKCLIGRDYGFDAEIQTLGKFKHRNIVRLLGFVSNGEINLLLYEYMPNGSLGGILHGPQGEHLQWEARYKIAIEVAKGLCYLHHDCSPLIIHRDVKSNNILLDSNFEAHVADFGLAKFFRKSGASEYMSCIAGSFGYIAPEYVYTLKVDEKSDVYSFGVVLLKLITGKKPVGEFGNGVEIVRWVRERIMMIPQPSDASVVLSLLDLRLSTYSLSSVVDMLKIAMMCVRYDSTTRPTIREVVYMLTKHPPSQSLLVE